MNFKHTWIVFKKEMTDTFRDKRSVLTNILLPLILIPALYFCMNLFIKGANKDVQENMSIALFSNEDYNKVEEFTKTNIVGQDKIEIKKFDTKEAANKALMDGEINCIIEYADNFIEQLNNGRVSNISIKYNSTKNSSQMGAQMLQAKVMSLNQVIAAGKLQELNISPEILNLVNVSIEDAYVDVSSSGQSANMMLLMIIPMYLGIIIVTAGTPMAIDLFAGERERNTFEALLSTKANRLSILTGKYAAVVVFSVLAIITSFIGLILGLVLNPEMFSSGTESVGIWASLASLNIPIGAMLLTLLSAITLAMAFAGIQIAISTYTKTLKEAQTYLSYMTFPAMIPALATMFMGAGDMQSYMSCIPIFNTICAIKMVLGGVIDYGFLIIGVIVNIVFVIAVTAVVIRMFNNEKIIIK